MIKTAIKFTLFIFIMLFFSSCASVLSNKILKNEKVKIEDIVKKSPNNIYIVEKPNQRIEKRDYYFVHEYQKIKERRKIFGYKSKRKKYKKPRALVGLAFSGGGIRSNAFQLGILSGLSRSKKKHKTLLNRVDYISSTSGGSWANGTYWMSDASDKLIFKCFDEVAKGYGGKVKKECSVYEKVLRYNQEEVITSGMWLEAIKNRTLMGKDIKFSEIDLPKYKYLKSKPYPIFNATHSVSILENSSADNYPMEITPDYFGTIVDCGSGKKFCNADNIIVDKKYKGFFVKQNTKDIEIVRDNFFDNIINKSGNSLSKTIHASSAVVAKILSMDFKIKYKGLPIEEIKESYNLCDGGKSDNLGILPLIERGVDLIIVSQISYDPKISFEDFKISSAQVKKLLNRRLITKRITRKKKRTALVEKTTYRYKRKKEGDILFIKPTFYNIKNFVKYLKSFKDEYGDNRYPLILEALEKDKKGLLKPKKKSNKIIKAKRMKLDKFPQTPTFESKYPKHLTYAYFMLGRFVVDKYLAKEIRRWEKRNRM